jgi:hypothetical protein
MDGNVTAFQAVGGGLLTLLITLAVFVMGNIQKSEFPKLDLHTFLSEIVDAKELILALGFIFIAPLAWSLLPWWGLDFLLLGIYVIGVYGVLRVLENMLKWMKSDRLQWSLRSKFLKGKPCNREVWVEIWNSVKKNNNYSLEYFYAPIFFEVIKKTLENDLIDYGEEEFRYLLRTARGSTSDFELYQNVLKINNFDPDNSVARSIRRFLQDMIITDFKNDKDLYLLEAYVDSDLIDNDLKGNVLKNYKKVIEGIQNRSDISNSESAKRLIDSILRSICNLERQLHE